MNHRDRDTTRSRAIRTTRSVKVTKRVVRKRKLIGRLSLAALAVMPYVSRARTRIMQYYIELSDALYIIADVMFREDRRNLGKLHSHFVSARKLS